MIAAIGITNQRETVVIWDRKTGKPIHNAIVWQDRRTAPLCAKLKKAGPRAEIHPQDRPAARPLFLRHQDRLAARQGEGRARRAPRSGELLAGTIDTFLIWRLTGGKVHATDATNASRTLLYNIAQPSGTTNCWTILRIPRGDAAGGEGLRRRFRHDRPALLSAPRFPILRRCRRPAGGDHRPGLLRARHDEIDLWHRLLRAAEHRHRHRASKNRLLTTIAYRLNGKTTYALEGSIFIAGAAVQWLRDGLKRHQDRVRDGRACRRSRSDQDVYLVPAFVGLGAPHWDAEARGAIFGLTRNSGPPNSRGRAGGRGLPDARPA
jgi:glycerol kinase